MKKYLSTNTQSKSFISISKAAKFLGVSADTLRNWEKQEKLIPQRTTGGARRYSLDQLHPLKKELNPLPKKQYGLMSISKAAQALGVSADTLRNWEKKGTIKPLRTEGGVRRFTKAEIKKMQSELGYTPRIEPVTITPSLIPTLSPKPVFPWFRLGFFISVFLLIAFLALQAKYYTNPPVFDNKQTELIFNKLNLLSQKTDDSISKLANTIEDLQKNLYNSQNSQNSTSVVTTYSTSSLQKGLKYVDLIGETIIDSLGNIYPSADTQAGSKPVLGTYDRKFFGLSLNNFEVNKNGDLTTYASATLGDNLGDSIKVVGGFISDIVPQATNSINLGTSERYIKKAYLSTVVGDTSQYNTISGNNMTFTSAGGYIDLASATLGNTFIWKIPTLASGSCSSGAAEGIILKDADAIQRGHICNDSAGNLKFYAQSFNATSTDLAENYSNLKDDLEAADLVKIDPQSPKAVLKSDQSYQNSIIGVVSTKPGLTLTNIKEDQPTAAGELINPKAVALAGRVPVKVSTENGPIQKGDYLASSSVPGVAMKATKPGQVVGKALEDFNGPATGKIEVFINVSFADPSNILANLTIDSDGSLIIPKIKTGVIYLDPSLAVAKSESKEAGGRIDHTALIQVGQLASTKSETTTPNPIEIASHLETIDKKLADQEVKLSLVKDVTTKVENQTNLLSDALKLTTSNLSDLSKKIDDLLISYTTPESTSSALTNKNIASTLQLSAPEEILASESAKLEKSNISDNISSSSKNLLSLTVSDTFKSLGKTRLSETSVAGDFSIDGTLLIDGNSINSIGTSSCLNNNLTIEQCSGRVLHLQNSPLAGALDIFNGQVLIDKFGNIKANSVIVAEFKVLANKISGHSKIPSDQKSVEILNQLVSKNSRILITPTEDTDLVLAVTSKIEGKKFLVSTPRIQSQDIEFDWFMINEVGD